MILYHLVSYVMYILWKFLHMRVYKKYALMWSMWMVAKVGMLQ